MPYKIEPRGERFCVVKATTGETMPGGCHPTRAEATRHMRAIQMNEYGGKAFTVLKAADGHLIWVSVASNPFKDLDGEYVSLKALVLGAAYANLTGEHGTLYWGHADGRDGRPRYRIGKAQVTAIAGVFLLKAGTFDETEAGRAAASYFAAYNGEFGPLGTSIGFYNEHDGKRAGQVYEVAIVDDISPLPLDIAANPYTGLGVAIKDSDMSKLQDWWGRFAALVGDDKASELKADFEAATQELDAAGVSRKAEGDAAETTAAEPVAEAKTPAAPAKTEGEAKSEVDVAGLIAQIVDERLGAFAESLGKTIGETTRKALDAQQATYDAQITDLSAQLKALKDGDEQRKAWLPRSVRDDLSRASKAAETALTTKQAAQIQDVPGENGEWGLLKVSRPNKRK